MYDFLSQFTFRVVPAITARANDYIVRAYTYVYVAPSLFSRDVFARSSWQWVQMRQYDRGFSSAAGASTYLAGLCSQGRALGPQIKSGNTVRNSPVIVRMFRLEGGQWVVDQECRY